MYRHSVSRAHEPPVSHFFILHTMTTHKDYTSGTDTHKVNQWDRSGGPDMKPAGNDTTKTGTDPHQKEGSNDPKKM